MARASTPAASWTLGVFETCDIRVVDEYVSGLHARITRDRSGQVWLEDCGSTNGTYVQFSADGPKVRVCAPVLIHPGVVVWLGARTSIPWSAPL